MDDKIWRAWDPPPPVVTSDVIERFELLQQAVWDSSPRLAALREAMTARKPSAEELSKRARDTDVRDDQALRDALAELHENATRAYQGLLVDDLLALVDSRRLAEMLMTIKPKPKRET